MICDHNECDSLMFEIRFELLLLHILININDGVLWNPCYLRRVIHFSSSIVPQTTVLKAKQIRSSIADNAVVWNTVRNPLFRGEGLGMKANPPWVQQRRIS